LHCTRTTPRTIPMLLTMRIAVLIATLRATVVSALPNVTVVPLENTCASYPIYDKSTGIAGPWVALPDSTGTSIDRMKVIPIFATAVGGFRWGFVSLAPRLHAAVHVHTRKTRLRHQPTTEPQIYPCAVRITRSKHTWTWGPPVSRGRT
jgi:hypothetical protein